MRIAIDARGSQTPHAARGVGRVIREFVDAAADLDDHVTAGVVVVGDAKPSSLPNRASPARLVGGLLTPAASFFDDVDVVLRLAPTAPSSVDGHSVVCCYDLIPLKAMGAHFPVHRRLRHPLHYVGYGYGLATVQRATEVWTISRAVADDVERLLHVPRARLHPIGLAPATLPTPTAARRTSLRNAYGLDLDGYVLWVLGGTNENKNVPGMLRVMAQRGLPPLVVVGGHPPAAQQRVARMAKRASAPTPRFLGHVDNESLAALLRDAACVVVPSLDEGFGLPVVEARAAGARVVANDIAVLREVGDSGVVYVDVNDAVAFAGAIAAAATTTAPPPPTARTWRDVAMDVLSLCKKARA